MTTSSLTRHLVSSALRNGLDHLLGKCQVIKYSIKINVNKCRGMLMGGGEFLVQGVPKKLTFQLTWIFSQKLFVP